MWLYFSSDYTCVKGGNYLFTILYLYNCFLFICRYADRSVFSNPVILHPDLWWVCVKYWKKGPVLLGDGRYVGDLVTWSCRWPNGFAKIRRCTKLVVTSDGIKCWGHPDSGEASSTGSVWGDSESVSQLSQSHASNYHTWHPPRRRRYTDPIRCSRPEELQRYLGIVVEANFLILFGDMNWTCSSYTAHASLAFRFFLGTNVS